MHTDVNECSDGTHTCQQVCDNTRGAFRCMCNSGFALNNDGFSCRGEYTIYLSDGTEIWMVLQSLTMHAEKTWLILKILTNFLY